MNRRIIITCFILLFVAQIQAQTEEVFNISRFSMGVEAGMDALFGGKNKLPMIRENHSSSYYYDGDEEYHCGFILPSQTINSLYLGLKPEYVISKRFTVSTGIRFSFNKIVYDSDRDYFLWKISESTDENYTNYLKIRDITQKNYYIGIPMEIKFYPREIDAPARQYCKLGVALNFLATSTEDVSFQNPAMNNYTADVLNKIDRISGFHGCVYVGVGFKIGNTNYPFGNIEFHFPVGVFSKNGSNSLVNDEIAGLGFQAALQIPLFKKHQLTYTVIDDD